MRNPIALLVMLGVAVTANTATASVSASHGDLVSVRIEVTSFGLGGSASETMDLTPQGKDFLLRGVKTEESRLAGTKATSSPIKKQVVSGTLVKALVAAATAPPVSRAAGIGQLTSTSWLAANADASYEALFPEELVACSAEARSLFLSQYKNNEAVVKATNAYFDTRWTDYYPSAKVTVVFSDGTTTEVQSHSQQAFMLPWKIGKVETWNTTLATALAALLPKGSDYKQRFTSADLLEGVARNVRDQVGPQWENLEGRCLYKSLIAKLTPHFSVARVFHTGPETLSATLTKEGMPPNLVIDVRLPGGESRAARAAFTRFLQKIPVYIEVARPFVTANPTIKFELWYSEGTSFNFADDEYYGQDSAVEFLRGQPRKDEGVLLREYNVMRGREWVVLPDGKSVLWNKAR